MLGQTQIKQLSDHILACSSADQTEVVILSDDSALTRFANSSIHQNVAETNAEIRIRVVLGTRVGVATTNNLDQAAVERTLQTAIDSANLQPENPDFLSLPSPLPLTTADAFSDSTAQCTPEQRARGVGIICQQAREAGMTASGALATTQREIAVSNSLGVSAYHQTTHADINTTVLSDNSAGYAALLAQDINTIDFEAIGLEAVEKCVRGQNPRPLDPGPYTVILEPYATQDIVQMLAYTSFSALAVQEKRSFMAKSLGEQVMDRRISIWDDGLDPAGIPLPFDFEGMPKQHVPLIKDGIAHGVVYDSYRAGKETGKQSTGHALPAPNSLGPFPVNTFFAPGDTTVAEMIKNTERGLYITYFHYTRPVEPTRVVITGMTRNGTFLIENGEIAYPVKNMRFTQSYLDALNQVEAIGGETKLLSAWNLACQRVPALKLANFHFTGTTEF